MDQLKILRHIDILMEIWNSMRLLSDGLAILQRSKYANDNHHSFLLLIATGLERLYKIILTLDKNETNGQFLYPKQLKKFSHKLVTLNEEILKIGPPGIDIKDLEDPTSLQILSVLEDFLGDGRYMFLDNFNDPTKVENLPTHRWNQLGFDHDGHHHQPLLGIEKIARCLCSLLQQFYLNGKIQAGSPVIWTFLRSKPGTTIHNKAEWGIPPDQI